MDKIDFFILKKVMRLAHFLDWKYHWNNYLISAWLYQFSIVCLIGVAAVVVIVLPNKDGGLVTKILLCTGNPLIAILQIRWANKMKRASDKWERDPSQIPSEAFPFLFFPPAIRLFGIAFGIIIGLLNGLGYIFSNHMPVWFGLLGGIFWAWNGYDSLAMYFCGIPPSRRQRKKKESKNWSLGLTLKPIGAPS